MTDIDKQFQADMVRWFYSFTNSVETQAQEEDSLAKLHIYIDEADEAGIVSSALIVFTKTYIRESFKPVLALLSFRHYMDIYCGDVDENCFVESDNSSLKRDDMGPNANSKLFNSARVITQHTDRRMKKLQADAVKTFEKRILPKPNDTEVDRCRSELSKQIVPYRRDTVVQQWEMSSGKCSIVF